MGDKESAHQTRFHGEEAAKRPIQYASNEIREGRSSGTKDKDAVVLNRIVNKEAKLLGMSGTSSDMKELLDKESVDR